MFRFDSEAALLAAFRPKDRAVLVPPPGAAFPLLVRDLLGWVHPAGAHAFLVFAVPGGAPTGIAFESRGGGAAGVPHMCDWCHAVGAGSSIGLLTAQVDARTRAGVHVCADLSCAAKIEEQANRLGAAVAPALEKLVARVGRFAREALKIDLSGAGR